MQNVNERVSSLIQKQMKDRDLMQADLAKILRVTPANVCSKLKGKRLWKVAELHLLVTAGFDFSDLFTREA
ncbi:MAG: hypothetical protein Q618_VCMC00001G0594 [Varibaculum cambriense DORA_20]|nr:MAG: hypothetical protein Q618_VCMC00001G0594 [Varibaculum cambriense DORA_20]